MIVLVTAFLSLGWWQVRRAAAGNTLSFGYAFEWPLFAGFVIALWAREIRLELRGSSPVPPKEPKRDPQLRSEPVRVEARLPADDGEVDPALAAYNDLLAWLAADPQRRPSDYPRSRV